MRHYQVVETSLCCSQVMAGYAHLGLGPCAKRLALIESRSSRSRDFQLNFMKGKIFVTRARGPGVF